MSEFQTCSEHFKYLKFSWAFPRSHIPVLQWNLLNLLDDQSFHHEFNPMTYNVDMVNDVHAAIVHIHQHGELSCAEIICLFWLQ